MAIENIEIKKIENDSIVQYFVTVEKELSIYNVVALKTELENMLETGNEFYFKLSDVDNFKSLHPMWRVQDATVSINISRPVNQYT